MSTGSEMGRDDASLGQTTVMLNSGFFLCGWNCLFVYGGSVSARMFPAIW
jgi:hypothetical protein